MYLFYYIRIIETDSKRNWWDVLIMILNQFKCPQAGRKGYKLNPIIEPQILLVSHPLWEIQFNAIKLSYICNYLSWEQF